MTFETLSREEKLRILKALEEDLEFRYAVAGLIGISEILRRLDRFEEGQNKLWENQKRLWEAQNKLWENQNKLWEEVKSLREGQNKLWEEIKNLREGQNKLWEEVRELRVNYRILEKSLNALRESMISGFSELSKFAGLTFEEFVRKFLTNYLRSMGVISENVEFKPINIDGEEINIFLEDPS
ncbi:MAG: hypothetical protein QW743_03395 [Candidatus Methanomethylicia archaeon]